MESGYYPPGAEHDPNAPWNQSDPEEKEFDVCISQSLSKSTTVTTTDYSCDGGGVDWDTDYDEDGNKISVPVYDEGTIEVSSSSLQGAYNNEHYTPLELIEKFKEYLIKFKEFAISRHEKKAIDNLIKECEGWTEDETEVVEE